MLVADPPAATGYRRNENDAPYIDLAIATGAMLIVSRDRDLLDLMSDDDPVGVTLRREHPTFAVLTPPEFLRVLGAPD
jgi:predicted nucleic acid-binding protein